MYSSLSRGPQKSISITCQWWSCNMGDLKGSHLRVYLTIWNPILYQGEETVFLTIIVVYILLWPDGLHWQIYNYLPYQFWPWGDHILGDSELLEYLPIVCYSEALLMYPLWIHLINFCIIGSASVAFWTILKVAASEMSNFTLIFHIKVKYNTGSFTQIF